MNETLRKVALEGIESGAAWLVKDGERLARYVNMLKEQPEYDTKAQDQMEKAERALTETLATVKNMLRAYKHKPREVRKEREPEW